MHKFMITVATTAAILLAGSTAWKSAAAPNEGAAGVSTAVQSMTPIKKAACQGWGPFCGPGYVRACGPYRCWCRPCY
jgi:hypothetical protein